MATCRTSPYVNSSATSSTLPTNSGVRSCAADGPRFIRHHVVRSIRRDRTRGSRHERQGRNLELPPQVRPRVSAPAPVLHRPVKVTHERAHVPGAVLLSRLILTPSSVRDVPPQTLRPIVEPRVVEGIDLPPGRATQRSAVGGDDEGAGVVVEDEFHRRTLVADGEHQRGRAAVMRVPGGYLRPSPAACTARRRRTRPSRASAPRGRRRRCCPGCCSRCSATRRAGRSTPPSSRRAELERRPSPRSSTSALRRTPRGATRRCRPRRRPAFAGRPPWRFVSRRRPSRARRTIEPARFEAFARARGWRWPARRAFSRGPAARAR